MHDRNGFQTYSENIIFIYSSLLRMESLYKQANCTGHNWPRRYVNILWAALYRSIDVRYFSLEVRFFTIFTQTLTALFDTYGRESEIIGNSRPLKSWPSKFSPALSLGIRINQCWETLRRHELLLFYIIQGVQHWSVPFESAKKLTFKIFSDPLIKHKKC